MALNKPTVIEAVGRSIRQADPGRRPVATLAVVWGEDHPLLDALITGIDTADTHFVTLTDRAVLVHRIRGAFFRQPDRLTLTLDREEARSAISDVRRGVLWSSFQLQPPGGAKPVRLSVCRAWFPEMDRFLAELAVEAAHP
ncbi:hypothetical protein ACH4E7_15845 [Kitasatospora sp. NPDC018058]|uniref:hypothetical protein n=1 Tax=Kitasatospora sp. NPDC018058 TaxID=3364025 RepID=UPI0037BF9C7A